jgi:hypothetical protein
MTPRRGETDAAAVRRKEALRDAWAVVSGLTGAAVAERLRVSRQLFYAWIAPGQPNYPGGPTLRTIATLLRHHASRLTSEAGRLDRAADEADAERSR